MWDVQVQIELLRIATIVLLILTELLLPMVVTSLTINVLELEMREEESPKKKHHAEIRPKHSLTV
jgi:hypothetical protein